MTDKNIKKAYVVNTSCLEYNHESVVRGYLEHEYADTEHEARKKLLAMCINVGVDSNYMGDDLTYVNIRVKRLPELDKFLVDGKYKTQAQIDYDNAVAENKAKLNQLLIDNPDGYAYIRKGGYFYCSNFCGYTEYKENAGVYTVKQAVNECIGCDIRDFMRPELIDIEAHNKMITDKISALKTKLIPVLANQIK